MYSNLIAKEGMIKTDSQGNLLKTGEKDTAYSFPMKLKGNIVDTSGVAYGTEYGLNNADCDAVISLTKNSYPIVEGSLIWRYTEPRTDNQGYAIKSSADYIVQKVNRTSNVDRVLLKRLVNGK